MTEDEQIRQQVEAASTLQMKLADDFTAIMGTESGRRWVWHLIAETRPFQPIFHEDHAVMCVREGKRQIGLKLLQDIQTNCPHQYQVMLGENAVYTTEEK